LLLQVYDFPTALLFSIETQQTIGYGYRCMNPSCPHAIALLMLQSCFGACGAKPSRYCYNEL